MGHSSLHDDHRTLVDPHPQGEAVCFKCLSSICIVKNNKSGNISVWTLPYFVDVNS